MEALIFTSEGDMRQAINNLQSTAAHASLITPEAVFKVCDQPHPVAIKKCLEACMKADVDEATGIVGALWGQGYSALDVITTIFKVVKAFDGMPEYLKLEFIKVN